MKLPTIKRKVNVIELNTYQRDKLLQIIFNKSRPIFRIKRKINKIYQVVFELYLYPSLRKYWIKYVFKRARKNIYRYRQIVVFVNPYQRLLIAIIYTDDYIETRYFYAKASEKDYERIFIAPFIVRVTKIVKKGSNKYENITCEYFKQYALKNFGDVETGMYIYKLGFRKLMKFRKMVRSAKIHELFPNQIIIPRHIAKTLIRMIECEDITRLVIFLKITHLLSKIKINELNEELIKKLLDKINYHNLDDYKKYLAVKFLRIILFLKQINNFVYWKGKLITKVLKAYVLRILFLVNVERIEELIVSKLLVKPSELQKILE